MVRVIMAETSKVFSNAHGYSLSGILLKIGAAIALPIMLYGFSGNLKVGEIIVNTDHH